MCVFGTSKAIKEENLSENRLEFKECGESVEEIGYFLVTHDFERVVENDSEWIVENDSEWVVENDSEWVCQISLEWD